MLKEKFLSKLRNTPSCLVILSGGMDSTIATRLCQEKYGSANIHTLSFYYKQKQSLELERAKQISHLLNLHSHQLIDISFLGDIVKPVSANIQGGLEMPTIQEILGDPSPPTEVPFRNGLLLMIAAAYAQSHEIGTIITGIQSQDQYSYFDTTPSFIESINQVLSQNRVHDIQVVAPFLGTNKTEEIQLLYELDGDVDLLKHTLTCYNPSSEGVSCGKCPSCAERIAGFMKAQLIDPLPYAISISW